MVNLLFLSSILFTLLLSQGLPAQTADPVSGSCQAYKNEEYPNCPDSLPQLTSQELIDIYQCTSTKINRAAINPYTGPDGVSCDFHLWNHVCYYNSSPVVILAGCYQVKNVHSLDLTVSSISIVQENSTVGDDGLILVRPSEPTYIDVQITGLGQSTLQTGNVDVTLQVGTNPPEVKTVQLSNLLANQNQSITVRFTKGFEYGSLGLKSLKATVNESKAVSEANFENNTRRIRFQVQCHVKQMGRTVPFMRQADPLWSASRYDHTNGTMKGLGCATSSLAMILSSYGLHTASSGKPLDPGTLNSGLTSFSTRGFREKVVGYTSTGAIHWQSATLYARSSFANQCLSTGGSTESCLASALNSVAFKGIYRGPYFNSAAVEAEICQGNPVMLEVPSLSDPLNQSKSHFVVAVGTTNINEEQTFLIRDPANQIDEPEAPLNVRYQKIKGSRLLRPTRDPSMMFIYASKNVDLLITDPEGRKAGRDAISGITYNEIPGAIYTEEPGIADSDLADGSDDSTESQKVFQHMDAPLEGNYEVSITSTEGGKYEVTAYGYDTDGFANSLAETNGTLRPNTSKEIAIQHSESALPVATGQLNVKKLIILAKPKKNENMLLLQGNLSAFEAPKKINGLSIEFQLKIGDFIIRIPATDFKKIGNHHNAIYLYRSSSSEKLMIMLRSNGEFIVSASKLSLGIIDQSKLNISVAVDDIKDMNTVQVECNKYLCKGK